MKKQEILEAFEKKIRIENYSEQTIRNYLTALKLFLESISKLNFKKVTDKESAAKERNLLYLNKI